MASTAAAAYGSCGTGAHRQFRDALLREHPALSARGGVTAAPDKGEGNSAGTRILVRDTDLWTRFKGASKDSRYPQQESPPIGTIISAAEQQLKIGGDDVSPTHPRGEHDSFGPAYFPSEQTLRPDHSWNYAATAFKSLPADAVKNPYLAGRFLEYPKLRRLLQHKQDQIDSNSIPPTYLSADLRDSLGPPPAAVGPPSGANPSHFHLASLMPVKYDVVLIDPPLECYEWDSVPSADNTKAEQNWTWEMVSELPIPLLAAKESFVFLWVGPGCSHGLERGRETLSRWGYRRCEVITWCLTSASDLGASPTVTPNPGSGALASSSVHLLMGIRGTVRRSQDGHYVHCNVDTDVIFWPGQSSSSSPSAPVDLRLKPPEMYTLIENFCQGTRRIELFGSNRNLRRGWLTVGLPDALGPEAPGWRQVEQGTNDAAARLSRLEPLDEASSEFPQATAYENVSYKSLFKVDPVGCHLSSRSNLVPMDENVEALRPKTPPAAYATLGGVHHGGRESQGGEHGRGGWQGPSSRSTPGRNLPRGLGVAALQQQQRAAAAAAASATPSSESVEDFQTSAAQHGGRLSPSTQYTYHSSSNHRPSPIQRQFLSSPHTNTDANRSPSASPILHTSMVPSTSPGPPLSVPIAGSGSGSGSSSGLGLGAGGPVLVSVPSGDETLSGPQRSAIGLGMSMGLGVGVGNSVGVSMGRSQRQSQSQSQSQGQDQVRTASGSPSPVATGAGGGRGGVRARGRGGRGRGGHRGRG